MDLVGALASLLRGAHELIMRFVHPHLRGVLSGKNLALLRELNFVVRSLDFNIVVDLVWGLPMAGWARHCPSLVQRLSKLPEPLELSLDNVHDHNLSVLRSVRSTGDRASDELAWSKCEVEFASGGLLGPWYSLSEIPWADFRLLQRFVIPEQHGGQEPTVRCIDNALLGGQNAFTATTACHRPCDLDTWAAFLRVVASKCMVEISAITSDFKSAYRQVTSDPLQANLFVIAMWCYLTSSVVFGAAVSQLFGSGSAPLNFSRYPSWCTEVMALVFLLPMEQCVDDLLAAERKSTIWSGYHAWRAVADLCGWVVPDAKKAHLQRNTCARLGP